jgi:hypothetical protein
MKLSKSFLNNLHIISLAAMLCLAGCAHDRGAAESRTRVVAKAGKIRVALYPMDNMSGAFFQMKELRHSWRTKLEEIGVNLIDDAILEVILERHRIRYIGGVDSEAALALKEEAGADAVLITSLEYYNDIYPPKIALVSRLTSTGENHRILWMESVGLAGDDSPGLLGLGLIGDFTILQDMALQRLADSLAGKLNEDEQLCANMAEGTKYKPKQFYSAFPIDPAKKTTIAVVPFYNDSNRKRVGEIVQTHFTRQLLCLNNVVPIEPGLVREKMLGIRMIMPEGVSIRDVDVLTYILEADFVLSGSVFDYQDPKGGAGTPKIDFSALMINRGERKVIMLSKSYNSGDDGVFFYDVGRENNANVMAGKMSANVVRKMTEEKTPDNQQGAPRRFHDQRL